LPPEVDRYGGHLAWHALLLVAGEARAALLSAMLESGLCWQ
jgi:hypothetical protein